MMEVWLTDGCRVPFDADCLTVIQLESTARDRIHAGHQSSRPLSENYEFVGLLGEVAFAKAFHQPLDLDRKPKGDGGIDFVIPLRFTVDVKTARKPEYLIHEQGKVAADIYVLAQYVDGDDPNALLLGWEWGRVLASSPVRDFGYGILNHYIPRSRLRPMSELDARVMRLS